MEFDYKILEEKFNNLPEELQVALTSVHVAEIIKQIGSRYGLRVDQESVLYDLTGYVLLGLFPSSDFVKVLAKQANLDEKICKSLAEDLNKEVFDNIKSSMRQQQKNEADIERSTTLSLEQAGGFSVEPYHNVENESNLQNTQPINRADILSSIENPPEPNRISVKKGEEVLTEPLVDHLLTGSLGVKDDHVDLVEKAAPTPPATPTNLPISGGSSINHLDLKSNPAPRPRGPDAYREPLE